MYATLREYEGIKDPAQATQPLLDGLLAEMQGRVPSCGVKPEARLP